jgi:hypothetical protein
MTRAEWEELTLDEAIDWADYNYGVLEITSEDSLIRFAKEKIDDRPLICHATEKMNSSWCDNSPFEIVVEPLEKGCRQTLRRK